MRGKSKKYREEAREEAREVIKLDDELARVLAAREKRWEKRLALVTSRKSCLVTITLCLPVAYRTQVAYEALFHDLCDQFQKILMTNGIRISHEGFMTGEDGPACFLTTDTEASQVKQVCVAAEDSMPGGRMLDIDVMDREGNPIGRSELGLPPRKCFICEEPAAVCVSRKRHSKDELARQIAILTEQAGGLQRSIDR